jgi:hypothetical protein
MHKFRTKNQNKKGGQLRGWQMSFTEVKLQEIKSLEAIKNTSAIIRRTGK